MELNSNSSRNRHRICLLNWMSGVLLFCHVIEPVRAEPCSATAGEVASSPDTQTNSETAKLDAPPASAHAEEGIKRLRKFSGGLTFDKEGFLVEVNIEDGDLTDEDLAELAGTSRLRKLSLLGSHVTDSGLKVLRKLNELRSLALVIEVGDEGLGHIAGLTKLESLIVDGRKFTDAGMVHLTGLTRLHTLSLWGDKISDRGLEHLAAMAELETLYLHQGHVAGPGLEHLGKLKKLKLLSLNYSPISDESLKFLVDLPNLRRLTLVGTPVTDGAVDHLVQIKNLASIDITGSKITAHGRARLKATFPKIHITPPEAAEQPGK